MIKGEIKNISINNLISLSNHIFDLYKKDEEIFDLIDLENDIINRLSNRNKFIFIKELERTDDGFNTSLITDIDRIDGFNPILERLFFILKTKATYEINPTGNSIESALIDGLRNSFIIEYAFEYKLRTTFTTLLNNHINASSHEDKEYLSVLNTLLTNLDFKYKNNMLNERDIPSMRYYEIEAYRNNLLSKYIYDTIKTILAFTDEELEDTKAYAKCMCYQTLLRSLFVILNDYEQLASYEELYTNVEESTAKDIVKSAFISNYYDNQQIKSLVIGDENGK